MPRKRKSVGTVSFKSGRFYSGNAYISIPEDQDRDVYIKNCFNTKTVMIRGEVGEMWRRAKIDEISLQEIRFPSLSSEVGSPILWVKVPYHNQPMVVAVVGTTSQSSLITEEFQRRLTKVSDNGVVDIDMRAQEPELDLSVSSNVNGKGKLTVSVTNPDDTAELDLFVRGKVTLYATDKITLVLDKEKLDRVIELNADGISLGSEGQSAEPGVLGDTLESSLTDLINAIKKLTVPTGTGPSGTPINFAEFDTILSTLSEIKSGKLTLD